jgi:hypothetical protein
MGATLVDSISSLTSVERRGLPSPGVQERIETEKSC